MATNPIARVRRSTTNLHAAHTALLALRQHVPEADLCSKLMCTPENLKRWAYLGVPNSRASEVLQMWTETQALKGIQAA